MSDPNKPDVPTLTPQQLRNFLHRARANKARILAEAERLSAPYRTPVTAETLRKVCCDGLACGGGK